LDGPQPVVFDAVASACWATFIRPRSKKFWRAERRLSVFLPMPISITAVPSPHSRVVILELDAHCPGLDPVGGEFQPPFETGYPGGGAHLIFVLSGTEFRFDDDRLSLPDI
jgi:hypothetical protein